jgi:hypothetical protein
MNITVKTLLVSQGAISELTNKGLRPAVSFRLARLVRAAEIELKAYSEERNKLLERYGKPDKKTPGAYRIENDKLEDYQREMTELENQTVELPDTVISVDDLGETDISANALLALDWLVKE